jgi:hypothetical protein
MRRRTCWSQGGPPEGWQVVSVTVRARDGPQRVQAVYRLLVQAGPCPVGPGGARDVDGEEAPDAGRHLRARLD